MIEVIAGDCLEALPRLPADSVDACVTDPPYGLSQEPDIAEVLRHWLAGDDYKHRGSGFMGKSWDSFVPGPSYWREVFRVLKPGAHLLCFAGTRTQDLMGIALRMAGFEIRDCIRYEQGREAWPAWFYGSGFPKSLDISKAIDKSRRREFVQAALDIGVTLPTRSVEDWTREGHAPGDKWWAELKASLPSETWASIERRAIGKAVSGETAWFASGQGDITAPATPEAAQWAGWGTALKPAYEPILVARKPLSERTVAANVLKYGCGALNVDACRVAFESGGTTASASSAGRGAGCAATVDKRVFGDGMGGVVAEPHALGRFPANLIHDGSQEVLDAFAAFGERAVSGSAKAGTRSEARAGGEVFKSERGQGRLHNDSGTAARFFMKCEPDERDLDLAEASRFHYSAKASKADRMGTTHPTTKPISLIEYLCRLVTPPGGTVLDPFAGSGTLVPAARRLGINAILIEREPEYIADIERRIANDTEAVQRKDKPPAPPPAASPPTLFDAIAVG